MGFAADSIEPNRGILQVFLFLIPPFYGFKIVLVSFLSFVVQLLHACRSYVVEELVKKATKSDDRGYWAWSKCGSVP